MERVLELENQLTRTRKKANVRARVEVDISFQRITIRFFSSLSSKVFFQVFTNWRRKNPMIHFVEVKNIVI